MTTTHWNTRSIAPADEQDQAERTVTGTDLDIARIADALIDLGTLALAFGLIDRTAVYHQDRVTPESDTDHTVMLAWVACALAARCYPDLDLGLVAQFAVVHDAVEVYAGDTPTLRITEGGRAAKARREHAALTRLVTEFDDRLPWFPVTIADYEAQATPEARLVRGLDKIMPKVVHILDGCTGLHEQRIDAAELVGVLAAQRQDMAGYVGEFTAVMDLHREFGQRVLAALMPATGDQALPHTVPCGFGCGHLAESETDLDAHEAGCERAPGGEDQ